MYIYTHEKYRWSNISLDMLFVDQEKQLEIVKSFKCLGTVLDERLSFSEHVDYV